MADNPDELIDYEDEDEQTTDALLQANDAGNAAGAGVVEDGKEVKKGSYVGVHATGFRDFLLKPELLRAISDCGFEHPSEGMRGLF